MTGWSQWSSISDDVPLWLRLPFAFLVTAAFGKLIWDMWR